MILFATLFAGAFLDATLGACFFVFGEAFFLMAGGLVYIEGDWLGVAAVLTGAYTADQTGYLIGRKLEPGFRRFALTRTWRRRMLRKASRLLDEHGILAVAASRFLGPVAWFTPPACGSIGMPWRTFALGSAAGVALAVGMFVALGFASAWGADRYAFDVDAFVAEHKWSLLLAGQAIFLVIALVTHYVGSALFRRW